MTIDSTRRGGKTYPFYRCATKKHGFGTCESAANIGAAIVEAWADKRMLARLRELGPSFQIFPGPDTDELDAAVTRAKLDVEAWDDAFDADSDREAFKRGRERRMATLAEAEAARAEAVAETQISGEQAKWLALWRAANPERSRIFGGCSLSPSSGARFGSSSPLSTSLAGAERIASR